MAAGKRAKWLATKEALAAFGCKDTASGRRKWVERVDRRAVAEEAEKCGLIALPEEMDARCSHLRRGWYWGSQAFGEKMLKLARAMLVRNRSRTFRGSLKRRTHDISRAEQLLQEGLQAAGLDLAQLQRLSGADARKVAIARAIWEQTVVSQKWLAQRLGMRSAAKVSQQLRRHGVAAKRADFPLSLRKWLPSVEI